jgi:hypothetical protein
MLKVPKSRFSCSLRGIMRESNRNVQKTDVRTLDILRGAVVSGLHRLTVRTRKIRVNWWTGKVAAEETVTTVESIDARH